MINQQIVTGNWHQVKGEIQKAWSRVSGDDLERAKGDVNSLIGVIEKQYGSKKEDVMQKLENIVERFETPSSQQEDELEDEDLDDSIFDNRTSAQNGRSLGRI
jgi:uncharacterized protein YjbJ (UPF0337 family)